MLVKREHARSVFDKHKEEFALLLISVDPEWVGNGLGGDLHEALRELVRFMYVGEAYVDHKDLRSFCMAVNYFEMP